jgi:3-dehydroquinate synthase
MRYEILGKTCEIFFQKFSEIQIPDNSCLIIDHHIYELQKSLFKKFSDRYFIFTVSEGTKNLTTLSAILDFLIQLKINRSSLIIGIGGGITTDIAAFAASIYKRGCRLMLVPTTLVAMADAALGGKSGINHGGIKNLLGSFYPAEKIIIDPEILWSLPPTEYLSGLTEIIKMSYLNNSQLDKLLCSNAGSEELIKESIHTKMELCSRDPLDRAERRLLNLGHTFGHILESASDMTISHGQAVAIGIRAAIKFSRKKKLISEETSRKLLNKLDRADLPQTFSRTVLPQIRRRGAEFLANDKKIFRGINLVLFRNEGKLFVYETDEVNLIISVLCEFCDET